LIQLKDKSFKPFIHADTIQNRIKELAQIIDEDYHDKKPVFVIMLKGAFLFAADLLKKIQTDCEVVFVRTGSYNGTQSSGDVKLLIPFQENLQGKDVIIIEDIVDSGKTLHKFIPMLKEQHPASIKVATLLFKPQSLQHVIHPDYVGFEIPEAFVVGYGMDYDELGRNLPDIHQLAL
jgi:hypoxanthine phosphoribosyltransferase